MRRRVQRCLRVLACAGALVSGATPGLSAQDREPYRAKSPGAARALSALGTAAPMALGLALWEPVGQDATGVTLLASGLVFGPALGYMYAGEAERGMAQAGIRALVLGGAVGGAVLICSVGDCSFGLFGSESGSALGPAVMLATAGVVTTAVLTVVDIKRVGDVVEERAASQVSARPAYFPESRSVGVLVTWRH